MVVSLQELVDSAQQQFSDFVQHLLGNSDKAFPAAALFTEQRLSSSESMPGDPTEMSWWMIDVLPMPELRLAMLQVQGVRRRLTVLVKLMSAMLKHMDSKVVASQWLQRSQQRGDSEWPEDDDVN